MSEKAKKAIKKLAVRAVEAAAAGVVGVIVAKTGLPDEVATGVVGPLKDGAIAAIEPIAVGVVASATFAVSLFGALVKLKFGSLFKR